jgi:hypothetical protein
MGQAQEAAKAAAPVTRIIISNGDKGGVGKSIVASAIIDLLYSKGIPVAVIEGDITNPDVGRMFGKHVPCATINLKSSEGWMDAMDFVSSHQGFYIVVSTSGGAGQYMPEAIPRFARFLADMDPTAELHMWWTINRLADSVNLLDVALASYGQYLTSVQVARNLFYGDSRAFIYWDESILRPKVEKLYGPTVNFPALHDRITLKMSHPDKIMPYSDAVDASVGEAVGLSASERFRLKDWSREVAACVEPVIFASRSKNRWSTC